MKTRRIAGVILMLAVGLVGSQAGAGITEIPERSMISKGGVLYPQIGDSSQERFQTPQNARQLFPPGTLVGVLPADCTSASKGGISYYRCYYDFAMEEVTLPNGRTVYRVIESP